LSTRLRIRTFHYQCKAVAMRFFSSVDIEPVDVLVEELRKKVAQIGRVFELNKTADLEHGYQMLSECLHNVEGAQMTRPSVLLSDTSIAQESAF